MMIWSDQQRALGEQVIVREDGKLRCLGYAGFCAQWDDGFSEWGQRLRAELAGDEARPRLRDLQHHPCDLVEALNPDRLRYTEFLKRAA